MTTGKTIALTRQTLVGKVMSLLFIILSRFVITFLPKSEGLLISWLAVTIFSDFGAPKNKVSHCFHCLESNPIPARDTQRAQTNLVCTRPQGPHRD